MKKLIFIVLILLSCSPTGLPTITNPKHPHYIGDYKLILDYSLLPDTLSIMHDYIVPYTTGKDTFTLIIPDAGIINYLDTTRFHDIENDEIHFHFTKTGKSPTPLSVSMISIDSSGPLGRTPNGRNFYAKHNFKIINPFSLLPIGLSKVGKKLGLGVTILPQFQSLFDSTKHKVDLEINSQSYIINLHDTLFLDLVDTTTLNCVAVVRDIYDNVSDTMRISISINNKPPAITIGKVIVGDTILSADVNDGDSIKVKEKKQLIIPVLTNDPDGDIVTLTTSDNLPLNSSFDPITGKFQYTPDFSVSSHTKNTQLPEILFFATDGELYDTFRINIVVLDSNSVPIVKDTSLAGNPSQTIGIDVQASDEDGNTLQWNIISTLKYGTASTITGTIGTSKEFSYTANNISDTVTEDIVIQITDGTYSCTSHVVIYINGENHPPVISVDGIKEGGVIEITESKSLSFQAMVNDKNVADLPFFTSANNLPPTAIFDIITGEFSFTPDFTVSSHKKNTKYSNVTLFATDKKGGYDTFEINIVVLDSNTTPTCENLSSVVNSNKSVRIDIVAHDVDRDTLSWKSLTQLQYGTIDIQEGSIGNGQEFVYTAHDVSDTLVEKVLVAITDSVHVCTCLVTITINGENSPPVIELKSPQNNASVPFGTVDITAEFSDKEGIKEVRFYIDDIIVHTYKGDKSPYTFKWLPKFGAKVLKNYIINTVVEDNEGITISSNKSKITLSGSKLLDSLTVQSFTALNETIDLTHLIIQYSDNNRISSIVYNGDGFHTLPQEIGNLTQINEIIIWNSPLYIISPELGKCKKLNIIKFPQNALVRLPGELFTIDSLKEIILDGNSIIDLPDEISICKQIEKLRVTNNKLKKLPKSIGNCNTLKEIYLNDNYLENLPISIGELNILEYLYVPFNKLRALPNSIGKCEKLKYLWLSNNFIDNLPPEIGKCINLTNLEISNNQLTSLPNEINKLKPQKLDLSKNKLSTEKKSDGSWKFPWQEWATKYDPDWFDTQSK